jgi:hypothetical protein
MQTCRDAQIVGWIGRLGAAGAEHVMRRFAMGRSMAYHRLGLLHKDGLLEHHAVLFGRPGMYTATNVGLRWQHLDRLGAYKVSPGGFEHAWQVAHAAIELERTLPSWQVRRGREVRSSETDSDELYASVQVGQIAGHAKLHRPDLVLVSSGGRRIVPIEVELSVKSAARLAAICRGWARARHVSCVYYLAADGPVVRSGVRYAPRAPTTVWRCLR